MFWRGLNLQHVAWMFVGIGIRKAMDIGAHRKRTYLGKPTVEGELWKRAFWLLVAYERIDSTALGRSCILQDEECASFFLFYISCGSFSAISIDVDLPLEVDDEYWETEDPASAFQQPKDIPASVTALNLWIRLTQIIAYALRTLVCHIDSLCLSDVILSFKVQYAVHDSRLLFGVSTTQCREEAISHLNTALSDWTNSVPKHRMTQPVFVLTSD
jgi:hypothetical protein